MSAPDDNPEARDPHLQQALRHAPDAQLQAPPALGDFILKEARAKARGPGSNAAPAPAPPSSPSSTPAPAWATQMWAWLARPAVATGFAGVMAATLVGLMWWDQPMDEAQPRSPVPSVAPVPEAVAPTDTPAAPPMAPQVEPNAAPKVAPKVMSPPPRAEADTPAPPPRAHEPARKAAMAPPAAAPARPAPPPPATPRQAPGAERETRRTSPTGGVSAGAAAPARSVQQAEPAPAAAPAPAQLPAATPPSVTADTAAPEALAKSKREEPTLQRGRTLAELKSRQDPTHTQGQTQSKAQAKAQFNASRLQSEAVAYQRVDSVRAAVATEPTRWAWQRGGGAAQPIGDAVEAWLARLDTTTGTRWQRRTASDTGATLGRDLTLLRDGRVQHRWQLTERGVLWERGPTAWLAELPADQLQVLQSALDNAAP